jgi:D-glycero-D-manno-heptose 1,7-bisphosphate phosphatase
MLPTSRKVAHQKAGATVMSREVSRAVFLDRDGTIGGDGGFCHPDAFALYPFAPEAIRLLKSAGYVVVMVTNQVRVSTGEITLEQVHASCRRIKSELRDHGGDLDAWYICPHHPGDSCACRKPGPGMLLEAARDLQIDLTRSFLIGDRGDTDMLAAGRAGSRPVLVLTGLGRGSIGEFRHTWQSVEPWAVTRDVLEAAHLISAAEQCM